MRKVKMWMISILTVVLILSCVQVFGIDLRIGDKRTVYTYEVSPTYRVTGGISRNYSWSTSNSSVIQIVSNNGESCTVKAVGVGSATVSNRQFLSYSEYDFRTGWRSRSEILYGDEYSFRVISNPPTSISLPSSRSLVEGDSTTLTVSTTPSDAFAEYTWSSSNSSVASVDSSGKVSAKRAGTTVITVRSDNGLSATCTVNVRPNVPDSISIPSSRSLLVDESTILNVTKTPSTSNATYTWTTSNSSVATVTSGGKVTAKGVGTATITVKSQNGLKDTCKITVNSETLTFGNASFVYNSALGVPEIEIPLSSESASRHTIYTITQTFNKIILVDNANPTVAVEVKGTVDKDSIHLRSSYLKPGHSYAIYVPANAIKCNHGYKNDSKYIASIYFPTLALMSYSPNKGNACYEGTNVINMVFSDNIKPGSWYDSIYMIDEANRYVAIPITKSINGNTLSVTANNLAGNHSYKIVVPKGSIKSNLCGSLASDATATFTVKKSPINIISTYPENGTVVKDFNDTILIKFDTEIAKGPWFESICFVNDTKPDAAYLLTDEGVCSIKIEGSTLKMHFIYIWQPSEKNNESFTLTIPAGALQTKNGGETNKQEFVLKFEHDALPPNLSSFSYYIDENSKGRIDTVSLWIYFDKTTRTNNNTDSLIYVYDKSRPQTKIYGEWINSDDCIHGEFDSNIFKYGHEYVVVIPKNAIENKFGECTENDIEFSFKLVEYYLEEEDWNFESDCEMWIEFSDDIYEGHEFDEIYMVHVDSPTPKKKLYPDLEIDGTDLWVYYDHFEDGERYKIFIPQEAVEDEDGNVLKEDETIDFIYYD